MSEQQPDLSTLPKRMRYAAEVLVEATNRYHGDRAPDFEDWRPVNLLYVADRWETEDAENQAAVEQMARDLYTAVWPNSPWISAKPPVLNSYREHAAKLIGFGWRKGDPA